MRNEVLPCTWPMALLALRCTTSNSCAGFIYKIDSRIELKLLCTAHEEWPIAFEAQENDREKRRKKKNAFARGCCEQKPILMHAEMNSSMEM